MSEYKSGCGCVIHVIQWSSKRKVVTVKNCPLHKHASDLLAALKEMAEFYGAMHEDDCPCDDTCECKYKPFNDRINSAISKADQP